MAGVGGTNPTGKRNFERYIDLQEDPAAWGVLKSAQAVGSRSHTKEDENKTERARRARSTDEKWYNGRHWDPKWS